MPGGPRRRARRKSAKIWAPPHAREAAAGARADRAEQRANAAERRADLAEETLSGERVRADAARAQLDAMQVQLAAEAEAADQADTRRSQVIRRGTTMGTPAEGSARPSGSHKS